MITCSYCQSGAKLVTGEKIYPHRKDLYQKKFWYCDNGHAPAYVGCHGSGKKPLGRLADAELRKWKSAAHAAFDPIWRYGKRSRQGAYAWLANQMGLTAKECHIGMFDVGQCQRVIDICRGVD